MKYKITISYEKEMKPSELKSYTPAGNDFSDAHEQIIEELAHSHYDIDIKPSHFGIVSGQWVSVKDRPLIKKTKTGWECTEDGEKEFLCYIPTNTGGYIRHCVIEDMIGLRVVGDDFTEPSGYQIEDITQYLPIPKPITANGSSKKLAVR